MQGTYLDCNATSKLTPGARLAWEHASATAWGNPNSAHGPGLVARRLLEASRSGVAELAGAKASEVIFTSGGTEANVMALHHMVVRARTLRRQRPLLLMGATEHSSVMAAVARWEALGEIRVGILPVMPSGTVDLDALNTLLPGAAGLCLMWANNETGVLNPLDEISQLVERHGVPWHCDAVQAVGRMAAPLCTGIGSLAISAHKLGGPKGCGALIARGGENVVSLMPVSSQGRDGRAGTPNVPAAAAFAAAARDATAGRLEGHWDDVDGTRDALESLLLNALPDSVVHGADSPRLPNTTNIALMSRGHWVDGDELAAELAALGIQVATGAACRTGTGRPSHVLTAMGVPPEESLATLRLSLGLGVSHEAVIAAGRQIVSLVAQDAMPARVATGQ